MSTQAAPPSWASTPSSTRVRLDYLCGLRGLAALAVVIGHAAQFCTGRMDGAVPVALRLLTYPSGLAVPTFIVLSGYCLALPVVHSQKGRLRGGALGFMKRRAVRILPAYYLALGLSLLCALALTHTTSAPQLLAHPRNLLGPLLLMQDLFGSARSYDVPLYTLAIEWHLYLWLPLLCWLGRRRRGALGLPGAALLLGALSLLAIGPLAARLPWVMPQFGALFALGILAAHMAHAPGAGAVRWRGALALPGLLPVTGALYVAWLCALGWDGAAAAPAAWEVGWGLICTGALVRWSPLGTQTTKSAPLRTLLGTPCCRWLGERSYSLYLLHWPVVMLAAGALAATPLGAPSLRAAAVLALALPAALCAATVLYHIAERPLWAGTPATVSCTQG